MEAFIKDQIAATLKYAPFHMIAGRLKKQTSSGVTEAKRKVGGFIKGVCHPRDNFEQIKGAGIEWNRADAPYPFDKDGNIRQDYINWKERMRTYHENGIKLMVVTPYPREFIQHAGIDPRLPENEAKVKEVAVFLLKDLKELIGAIQVTNEMGVPRFTNPLTMDEAVRYIGIQLEAMYPHRGDVIIGYNSAGPQADLHSKMRPWHKYCDYVGIDIYIGCFVGVGCWMAMFDIMLRYVWSITGKPVILAEFGYIGGGAPKTPEEKSAVLQRYGVKTEAEARANIDAFMEAILRENPDMWKYIKKNASGGYADFIFQLDFCNHFYSELPKKTVIKKYPHTPQGQAGFYKEIYSRLTKLPFMLGAFLYCYSDSERCYVCKQPDCPTETRWGIVTIDGKEKPAYYAVRDALAKIK
ncbi:MAG: hypothetical protein FWF05_04185 [Oscillospiraceae bacterium]|nr:hypothetical protein [Oscillospiraceae bacterium]